MCLLGRIGIFFIMFLVIIQIFAIVPSSAHMTTKNIVVSLDQSEQTAQVAPGQKGIVTFTGYVDCNIEFGSDAETITVTLEASAGGFAWSLTPSKMTFDNSQSRLTYHVSIRVPTGTSVNDKHTLKITGTYTHSITKETFHTEPAYGEINTRQFYKFSVSCPKQVQKCSGNSILYFDLSIKNQGNGLDTIDMDFKEGYEELMDENFKIIRDQNAIAIHGNETSLITISISSPLNIERGKEYILNMTFFSYKALSLGDIPAQMDYQIVIKTNRGLLNQIKSEGALYFSSVIIFCILGILIGVIVTVLFSRKRKGKKKFKIIDKK